MWQLQEMVTGVVIIQSRGELAHSGLMLTVDGSVNLQLSAKSVGMFEAFYNSLKVLLGDTQKRAYLFRSLIDDSMINRSCSNVQHDCPLLQ